jgi:hypothetical protein
MHYNLYYTRFSKTLKVAHTLPDEICDEWGCEKRACTIPGGDLLQHDMLLISIIHLEHFKAPQSCLAYI